MNKLRDIEENQPEEERTEKPVKGFKDVLSGSFLSREAAINVLPYLFFISFLGVLYIANGYQAERLVRRLYKTTNELKELRSEYITTKSELMYISKQSQVARATERFGLRELMSPPKKIVITKKEKEAILND